jgi:hypothetical protein
MIQMRIAYRRVIGKNSYKFSAVRSEWNELKEARRSGKRKDVVDEWADVKWTAAAWLYKWWPLRPFFLFGYLPAPGERSVDKYMRRLDFMRWVFQTDRLEFSVNYCSGGSNWAKPEKVKLCFEAANHPIDDDKADLISALWLRENRKITLGDLIRSTKTYRP